LLDAARLEALRERLTITFPRAKVLDVSVRATRGVEEWFSLVEAGEQAGGDAMEVDYETYAEGEALLGWLNATVQLSGKKPFDAETVLKGLATAIQRRLAEAEIAHLKMTLSPDSGLGDVAVINLVRSDFVPELSLRLEAPINGGQLIVNLRAEAAPEILRDAVRASVHDLDASAEGPHAQLDHLESFRPGKPQPTHRFTSLAGAQPESAVTRA
jgi:hypothetical protein